MCIFKSSVSCLEFPPETINVGKGMSSEALKTLLDKKALIVKTTYRYLIKKIYLSYQKSLWRKILELKAWNFLLHKTLENW